MLCVTEIKVIEVERDYVEIRKRQKMPCYAQVLNAESQPEYEEVEIEIEMVRGREFINARGERFCMGMSKDVQEAIGLPFDAFDNMNTQLAEQRKSIDITMETNRMLMDEIKKFKSEGYWKRLLMAIRNEL